MLFYWNSEYMSNYKDGHIIVCASNADAARDIVRKEFENHYNIMYRPHASLDEERSRLEEDILKEPNIVEPYSGAYVFDNVIFVSGDDG